jgi:hypothetical protein
MTCARAGAAHLPGTAQGRLSRWRQGASCAAARCAARAALGVRAVRLPREFGLGRAARILAAAAEASLAWGGVRARGS